MYAITRVEPFALHHHIDATAAIMTSTLDDNPVAHLISAPPNTRTTPSSSSLMTHVILSVITQSSIAHPVGPTDDPLP
jgi:hypothetical protein